MNKALPEIKEDISQLEHMLKEEKDARLKERIHALYLIKSKQAKNRTSVANMLSKHRTTIGIWLNTYKNKGITGLLTIETHSNRKSSIPPDVLEKLKEKLEEPKGFRGYKSIQIWISNQFGIDVPYKTLHGIVRYRLKAKPKIGRKSHIKKMSKKA